MKNSEVYKPTTTAFQQSIFRLLYEKGSTANLWKEDEFKITSKIYTI